MTAAMLWPLLLSAVSLCRAADLDQAYSSASLSLLRASAPASSSFVFSPLSLTAALAVLHEGADEVARKEMEQALLPGASAEELTKFYSGLMKTVLSDAGKQNLLMATRLFARDTYKLDKKFTDQAEKEYHAGVVNANFSDGAGSAKKINDFIATNTRDRIKNVVSSGDFADAVLFVVNALSFTASWDEKFWPGANEKRAFHGVAGKRENVEFMTAKHEYYSYHETSSAQVLSIPYEKSKLFSFVIILPKPDQDFKEFTKTLSPDAFHGLLTGVKRHNPDVKAVIPKFSLQSSMPAAEALKKLGVKAIFTDGNLKKIAHDPRLFVSDVRHEALLKIHENGTDAAATTVLKIVPMSLRLGETSFIADRPFLFALVAEKKHPVFLGQFV